MMRKDLKNINQFYIKSLKILKISMIKSLKLKSMKNFWNALKIF